ncbi:MAG: hypothetical protein JXA96_09220 [Sedimentisphaerales bacterium]|nr:hypothetical protein [Sedimentisphaerales bacterium]
MKRNCYLLMLLLFYIALMAGCQQGLRTDPSESPPGVMDDKIAQLDMLRILICSQEQVELSDESYNSDEMLQQVIEHFSNLGFRIVEGSPAPAYTSSPGTLATIANEQDVDMFVLLRAEPKMLDKLGNFYSYEVDGRGKVAQIVGQELLTTTSSLVRGERDLNERRAVDSALQACGQELAQKLSDEIVRKTAQGALLRRISVSRLDRAELVDYVRVGLSQKPGIESVSLASWNKSSGRAIFWVRLDPSVKENLAAYLEQIDNVKLRVKRLDNTDTSSRKKYLLER